MSARVFLSFFMPGGLLFLTAVTLVQTVITPLLPKIVLIYPPVVLATGILLGWRFNRSRLIFAVLLLAIVDRSLLFFSQGAAAATPSGKLVYNALAILLPLNLALLSLVKERGITTARGLCRIGLILAQPLAVAAICRYHPHYFAVTGYLDYHIFKAVFLKQIAALPLPQPALITTALAFLLVGYACVKQKGAIENGFFWALLTACVALGVRRGSLSTFYFSTAGLILVISVIEASYVMAFRDELTGLPARRALNESLLKLGNRYTVAMLDIDFFKKFNDTYGHDVGDQVLRMVASKISGVTGGAKAFRYGGEEFTVIYSGKSADEAVPHLEQLRTAIESTGFVVRSQGRPRKKPDKLKPDRSSRKSVRLTISIGVAERNGKHATPQEVIKAADKALYRAKKAGRNRVST